MAASLAGAGVSEHLARHHCQAERVIEFAICEQSSVGGDDGPLRGQCQIADGCCEKARRLAAGHHSVVEREA